METCTRRRLLGNSFLTTKGPIDTVFFITYWEGLTQQEIALEALALFFGDKQIKSRPECVKNRAKLGRKPKHA